MVEVVGSLRGRRSHSLFALAKTSAGGNISTKYVSWPYIPDVMFSIFAVY